MRKFSDETASIDNVLGDIAVGIGSASSKPSQIQILNGKPVRGASIQPVSFEAIRGADKTAIRKINAALKTASTSFRKEASECSTAAQGHPWGYELTFEKAFFSEKYLSVVFAKSTVCAGSPDMEKKARVFSLPSGNLISSKTLFKLMFPTAKLVNAMLTKETSICLDEEMAETMIDHSKEVLKNDNNRCDFYVKHSSYRIWMEGKNVILFPEFAQPESFCQKEYVPHSED